MTNLISATLVYDGSGEPHLPTQLLPSNDPKEQAIFATQFKGTPLEKLCEIGGRSCYHSFGKGRDSADFHKHILDVGHLSVNEHAPMVVSISPPEGVDPGTLAAVFINRPSMSVIAAGSRNISVMLNLRHVLEWDKFPAFTVDRMQVTEDIGRAIQQLAHLRAPQIVASAGVDMDDFHGMPMIHLGGHRIMAHEPHPVLQDHQWVSLFLTGSRAMSHEQVRHGDFTAISQRSTRFVDESTSPWVMHPLELAYHASKNLQFANQATAMDDVAVSVGLAKAKYKKLVGDLEPWLIARGVDKTSARKQARGAARGYLGNALYTELLFSASVTQWKRMLKQRASQFADAEIRQVYASEAMCVLGELKKSRYASAFAGWDMALAPDGIGHVLVIAEPAAAKA